jgi:hypothetical protein
MVKPEIIALHKTGSFCFALTSDYLNLTHLSLIVILLPNMPWGE